MDLVPSLRHSKTAVIDCGTNTFNLVIGQIVENTNWEVLFQTKSGVKIGTGGFEQRLILPDRYYRGIDVLFGFKRVIDAFQIDKTVAYGTSALREARNGTKFIADVRKVCGINIDLINGEDEADFIFSGVIQTIELNSEIALVMDIGGGSVEFIVVKNNLPVWKKSYPIGVSRLFEQFKPSDRLSYDFIRILRRFLDSELHELHDAVSNFGPRILIGSSGSFDTLWDLFVSSSDSKLDQENSKSQEIPLSAYPSIHQWLMGTTLSERLKHPAIPSLRAEYMPLSSFLVKYVLEMGDFKHLYRSSFSLKEGVLKSILFG
jgi:exopolyphosphatase/guanosine-5'-triphosphate,3'-diphosphate pyrophosphatase